MADWKSLATNKRDEVNSLIPSSWRLQTPLPPTSEQRDITGKYIQQYLSAREVEVTETEALDIVGKTSSGEWKAQEVAEAFCHRAALAHQLSNCLHEIFFDDAIKDAKKLDEYFEKNGKPIGPLHGLPISLKDQFHIKGVETTMGYVGWMNTFEGQKGTNKEKNFESLLAADLRTLGAILYCKTSVPHTLMSGETFNNIVGFNYNPKNRNLGCGGSSGGEGVLLSLRGSPLGFGTDIGGSIRIPAVFNGLYGIRPSSGRLPYEGMANSMDGQNSMLSVVGPLSPTIGGLELAFKGLLSKEPWLHDPLVVELPWRSEQENAIRDLVSGGGKLVFGVMRQDGVCGCHPPVTRAIEMVVQAVKKLGHEIVEWNPPSHKRATSIAYKTWTFDGGDDVQKAFALSGEPMSEGIVDMYGTPRPQYTASHIAAVNIEKRQFQKEYMEYWNSTAELTGSGRAVDAVICPAAPYATPIPGRYDYYGMTSFVNCLDYTAAVLPVTTADKSIDVFDKNYKPISETDKIVQASYEDPGIYDGAYVGVQLLGRRFQEEKILTITKVVADALKKSAA